jgi:hypothetical protein
MPYDVRYCAFADILGFSQLIADLEQGKVSADVVRSLLSKVHSPEPGDPNAFRNTDFRAQSISDAVAISTVATPTGLSQLFFSLEELSLALLHEGYFLRGAIVKERLYHDEKIVFGSAPVKAYLLESEVANFPRVMIRSDVADTAAKDVNWSSGFNERMKMGSDGPMFLHVLRRMQKEMNNSTLGPDNDEGDPFGEYHHIKRKIEERLKSAMDNPRHFAKVKWFAEYWNRSLPQSNATSFRVVGPGL